MHIQADAVIIELSNLLVKIKSRLKEEEEAVKLKVSDENKILSVNINSDSQYQHGFRPDRKNEFETKRENIYTCGNCSHALYAANGACGDIIIDPCQDCNKNKIDIGDLINKLAKIDVLKSMTPPKEEALKPCACGYSAAIENAEFMDKNEEYRVHCLKLTCKASTAYYATKTEAIANWSNRMEILSCPPL